MVARLLSAILGCKSDSMKKSILLLAILFSFKTFAQNYVDIISLSWDEGVQQEYGWNSQEMEELWKKQIEIGEELKLKGSL